MNTKATKTSSDRQRESNIVDAIAANLKLLGMKVSTEVANFNRSADIVALDDRGRVWVVECKVSDMSRAIAQLKTHKLSADMVCLGTYFRRTKQTTLNALINHGIGLIHVMPDGSVNTALEPKIGNIPWRPAKIVLQRRIEEIG